METYTLGDIFDRTFKSIRYTWKVSIILSLIVSLPLTAGFVVSFQSILKDMLQYAKESQAGIPAEDVLESMLRCIPPLVGMGILGFLSWIGGMLVYGAVTLAAVRGKDGLSSTVWDFFTETVRSFWARLIAQGVVKFFIFLGITIGSGVLLGLGVGLAESTSGISLPFGIVFFITGMVFTVYLGVRLYFTKQAIVAADEPILESLRTSSSVTRGSWWRALGIIILMQLLFSFASGLITSPVVSAGFLPFLSRFMELVQNNEVEEGRIISLFTDIRYGWIGVAAAQVIQFVLEMVWMPVFTLVLFRDLWNRRTAKIKTSPQMEGTVPPEHPEAGEEREF